MVGDVNELLAFFLDGDLGKWEYRAYAMAVVIAGFLAKFAFNRFVNHWDAIQKVREKDHIRLWQHDDEIVRGLRNGKPFTYLGAEDRKEKRED